MEKKYLDFLDKFNTRRLAIHPVLRPYIFNCVFYSSYGINTPLKTKCFSNGYVELIIHLDQSYFLFQTRKNMPLLNNYVIGLKRLHEPDEIVCHFKNCKAKAMVLRFTSLGVRKFLNLPMSEIHDKAFVLEDIWGTAGKMLQSHLNSTCNHSEQDRIMNEFLFSLYENSSPRFYFHIDDLMNSFFYKETGSYNIEKVADFFNMSYRTLHRKFVKEIGICPKDYLKILRFNKVCTMLCKNPETGLMDAAYRAGYYDLSHLNKEFKQVIGYSPARFLKAYKRKIMVARVIRFEV